MNLKDAQVPLAWLGTAVAIAYGAWTTFAQKDWVQERQEPLESAVISLSKNIEEQTAVQKQLAGDVRRNRSHITSDKILFYYNRLCYEQLDVEQRQGIRNVLDRYEAEYSEITGRPYDPPRCNR